MNRTASIKFKGLNFNYIKENLTLIVLMALTLVSILVGVLSVRNAAVLKKVSEVFLKFIDIRTDKKFFSVLLSVLISSIKLPAVSFLCGTSVLGTIISPLVLMYDAFGYGALSGYVYSIFGLSGIVFNLFVLLLPNLVMLFSLLISACECVSFSKRIAALCIRQTRPVNLYNGFRTFCIRHLILLVPILLSAFADIALFNIFEKYFNF